MTVAPSGPSWAVVPVPTVFTCAEAALGTMNATVKTAATKAVRRYPIAVPPYSLRHSFASLLLAGGRQPGYVARQLGHSTAVLWEHYEHLISELGPDLCQRPSVSPQPRPSVLPAGGRVFSPLVAIGSPHCVGCAAGAAEPCAERGAERRWPRREPSGQGRHPLAGGRLGESVAVAAVGDEHVGVVE